MLFIVLPRHQAAALDLLAAAVTAVESGLRHLPGA